MTKVCSHCSRVNPAEAQYCYFDGVSLLGAGTAAPLKVGSQPFPTPFVFPSGQTCRNFDQLALTCQQNWQTARDLLAQGFFEGFLGGLGRIDLAQAAQAAKQAPNLDRGLDQLLSRLPAESLQPPRLKTEPSQINLGQLRMGVDRQMELHLVNQGMRLLYGSVVSNCPWLVVSETGGTGQRLFQFQNETNLTVQIRGQHLRASATPIEGRLIFESNGGSLEVAVKADVPVQPFPEGVLKGATAPRQIAEKAKAAPKDAAALFENGAVAKWYQANGWTYPVQGPSGKGLGAVQQFFEALGLAKAPKVEISEAAVRLQAKEGNSLRHELRVMTKEKRPVWANGRSDQPWLVVGKPQFNGPSVSLPLEVQVPYQRAGETLKAQVTVTSNGNQRFVVPVEVAVGRGRKPPVGRGDADLVEVEAVAPSSRSGSRGSRTGELVAATAAEASGRSGSRSRPQEAFVGLTAAESAQNYSAHDNPFAAAVASGPGDGAFSGLADSGPATVSLSPSVRRRSSGRTPWMRLAPAGLLFLGLIALIIIDAIGKKKTVDPPDGDTSGGSGVVSVDVRDEPDELYNIEDEPDEGKQQVTVLIKDEPGEADKGGPALPVDPNARIKLNYILAQGAGRDAGPIFFGLATTAASGAGNKRLTFAQPGVLADGRTNDTVVRLNGKLLPFGNGGNWLAPLGAVPPAASLWSISPGQGAMGPIRFDQRLEVLPSKQPVKINGIDKRVLDTLMVRWIITNHDKKPHKVGLRIMVDTMIGDNDGVPFTIPGLPGMVNTNAEFRGAEVPDFIQALERPSLDNPGTIAHMTLRAGGSIEPPSRIVLTRWLPKPIDWEIPRINIADDSAVILYWDDVDIQPGAKREIGFAYGLGSVSADKGSKLGLTLGGSFEPGQPSTVTAYVKNPKGGQSLALELPDGIERISGAATQPVPAAGAGQDTSIVTWKVKVQRTGDFTIRVKSSDGLQQAKTISIARTDAGGKLTMDLKPPFEPGQVFTVEAKVENPTPNQSLTLNIPNGLQLAGGAMTQQLMPKGNEAAVQWRVKVQTTGRFPVRVQSSAGASQTKTLTINPPDQKGKVSVALNGDFAPGRTFRVVATVTQPEPNQTLKLILPPQLERQGGKDEEKVPPPKGGQESSLSWTVKIKDYGKFPVRVQSSTGVTIRKTLAVNKGDNEAGRFSLELVGKIEPKKDFIVRAKVENRVPGQKLTLQLPNEIELKDRPLEQLVPENGVVEWSVSVVAPGTLRIAVASTTGLTKAKTVTVKGGAGIFGN